MMELDFWIVLLLAMKIHILIAMSMTVGTIKRKETYMFFKKKSFNKPKPPVKKVTKKWEPTIDLSNIDKRKDI